MDEFQYIEISKSLETKPAVEDVDCNAYYTLWAYKEADSAYVEWGAMVSYIKQ
jgi:hypothetical protein